MSDRIFIINTSRVGGMDGRTDGSEQNGHHWSRRNVRLFRTKIRHFRWTDMKLIWVMGIFSSSNHPKNNFPASFWQTRYISHTSLRQKNHRAKYLRLLKMNLFAANISLISRIIFLKIAFDNSSLRFGCSWPFDPTLSYGTHTWELEEIYSGRRASRQTGWRESLFVCYSSDAGRAARGALEMMLMTNITKFKLCVVKWADGMVDGLAALIPECLMAGLEIDIEMGYMAVKIIDLMANSNGRNDMSGEKFLFLRLSIFFCT